MQFTVQIEQEVDGRWIDEVAEIPGAMKYGKSKAIALAEALALRVIADRLESGEQVAEPIHIRFAAA
jgi:predicted RNase H-like HicB family nuclease